MTQQTKMPDPVAWVRQHPDGALTDEFLEEDAIELVRKQSGAWKPIITTTQAEAYKDACVREALEEAASIPDEYERLDRITKRIRALIPK